MFYINTGEWYNPGMPSIVSVDIETTGLDSQKDAIIEIGAVRFNGHRVEAEFSTLINPRRPIPPGITVLTGITDAMVQNATTLKAILPEFETFVGDSIVLGHNVRFDISFLQRAGVLQFNKSIDTYELAAVLLPRANRYNLGALCHALNVMLPATHRALDDARATHGLFLKLYDLAAELPVDILAEIVRIGEPLEWGGTLAFRSILKQRMQQPVALKTKPHSFGPLFHPAQDENTPPLKALEPAVPLDEEEVAALLEYGGPFAGYFKGYEQRPQQVEMLRAVTRALSTDQHLMVEAGTGVGKSFAYLVPAALYAWNNNTRVIISTNTINLQDQLINKDIPDLCQALNLPIRATVLKGRSNYLCPRRLDMLRQRGPETVEQMRVLSKVLLWLEQGGSGDRNEINLNGPAERDAWMKISAEDEGCRAEVCMGRTGGTCPFYRAKQASQNAHLLIVNHALLLADVATGSRVLPDYNYVIIDEAHHLEGATTSALSFRVTQGDLSRTLRELGSTNSGILGHIVASLTNLASPSSVAAYHKAVQRATDLAFRLDHDFSQYFMAIQEFLSESRDGRPVSAYGQQERILPATRTLPIWTDVEITWDTAAETLKLLLNLLEELHSQVGDLNSTGDADLEDLQSNLGDLFSRLKEAETQLNGFVVSPIQNSIYWAEIPPNNSQVILQIAPLEIGDLMQSFLWHQKNSVILTSATLTANGEFDYLRTRLRAEEADELSLGSPFDYENSAMLYLANDIAEPSDANNYQRGIENTLIRLAKATGGRTLVLFTSYAQLKRTSQAISSPLSEAEIHVFEQGEGASPNALLESFRETERAVLLGTRAFWEGVDIPGTALSVVVIVKLPFDVPSDPIVAARSETFEDPFNEYSLPEAILHFRQGFGRLIRTQTDRGIVVILDKRILSKKYGRMFLESLPKCHTRTGSLNDLPAIAARWLDV